MKKTTFNNKVTVFKNVGGLFPSVAACLVRFERID